MDIGGIVVLNQNNKTMHAQTGFNRDVRLGTLQGQARRRHGDAAAADILNQTEMNGSSVV